MERISRFNLQLTMALKLSDDRWHMCV